MKYVTRNQAASQRGAHPSSLFGNSYLFTARRLDEPTGLYYYRNRYYETRCGRFIGRDPIGYAEGGLSLYHYVANKSVQMIDPFGLKNFLPKPIPKGAYKIDFSDIESDSAHVSLFEYYRTGSTGNEWVILGGDFLMDVRGQSEMLDFHSGVQKHLRKAAEDIRSRIGYCETETWKIGGYRLITADLSSTNVRLALQRFSVWWEAECIIGPKKKDGSARYKCTIQWVLRDIYDFRSWNPYSLVGKPYNIHGAWGDSATGTVP